MDIQTARDILQGANIAPQKEMDARNLALSILDNTFQADFSSRDAALQQASQAIRLNGEKDATIGELTTRATTAEADASAKATQIADLTTRAETAEKAASDAQTLLTEKDTAITSLTQEKADLTAQVASLTPMDTITPPADIPGSDTLITP